MGMILQWVLKLCAGWLPFTGEKLGKVLWVTGIVIICLSIYQKFNQSTNTTKNNQRADNGQIININHYYQPKSTFGCSSIPVRQYMEKKEQQKNEL